MNSATIRLTMAQALVRYLAAQQTSVGGEAAPLFAGVFAIFGHGNVAALGEALYEYRAALPTYRAHNEQAMAHTAIAYAKAQARKRMMAVTTSIGPGATNLVTAAALAHVNRLPVLLLPGDVFVSRAPDPVLQQIEDFADGTISVNDCFKPVSRYFDRIVAPAQLLTALPRAMHALTDPAACGPVTLALPQDVQAQAFDYPAAFFEPRIICVPATLPAPEPIAAAAAALRAAKRPMIIAGGGVLYGEATEALRDFAERHAIPVAETQAGKGSLPYDHPLQLGPVGVCGSTAANTLSAEADLMLAVGTRLADFTTGSNALYAQARLVTLNVNAYDAHKNCAIAVTADARAGLDALAHALAGWRAAAEWHSRSVQLGDDWRVTVEHVTAARDFAADELPYEADVIGAVQRSAKDSADNDIAVCAAGSLPGELIKLWRTRTPGGYHVEYGYSCMGYEIAGGLGVKMAKPEREVIVLVGDGSYLMLNSEIATSVMLGRKLVVVVLDNRGFGCIGRLQRACGSAPFNNLVDEDCAAVADGAPEIDFAAHARALGASAEHVADIAELEQALQRARAAKSTYVISIRTDPYRSTDEGGSWWDVAIPEVSAREPVRDARAAYETALRKRDSASRTN
jgi:3D-(3,5/4)-trihydroxycyclohexane-1,2-dione acylhydrolase (decyclizing)